MQLVKQTSATHSFTLLSRYLVGYLKLPVCTLNYSHAAQGSVCGCVVDLSRADHTNLASLPIFTRLRQFNSGWLCAQGLAIPAPLKELYKTVWEIKQRILVDMAADRGAFIDQSQSFNVHMSDPNFGKLTSLHFYAWKARGHPIVLSSVFPLLYYVAGARKLLRLVPLPSRMWDKACQAGSEAYCRL